MEDKCCVSHFHQVPRAAALLEADDRSGEWTSPGLESQGCKWGLNGCRVSSARGVPDRVVTVDSSEHVPTATACARGGQDGGFYAVHFTTMKSNLKRQ